MGKFAVVGILNTAIDVALFGLLFYVADWELLVANTASYSAALVHSYLVNKYWTFGDQSDGSTTMARGLLFVMFNLVGLLIANGVVWLLAQVASPLLAKFASVAATFTWNYWTSHGIVYRKA